MDIFSAARTALDREPAACATELYFSAVSAVLCGAIGSLVSQPSSLVLIFNIFTLIDSAPPRLLRHLPRPRKTLRSKTAAQFRSA
jgi:hypothetical protein